MHLGIGGRLGRLAAYVATDLDNYRVPVDASKRTEMTTMPLLRSALLVLLTATALLAAGPPAAAHPDAGPIERTVVAGSESALPIVSWVMAPEDFDAMTTIHRGDGTTFPADLSIDDTTYEGVQVQATGLPSTDYAKKTLRFDLGQGRAISEPYFDHPVSRIDLNASFLNMTDLQEKLASKVFEVAGLPARSSFPVQLWRDEDGGSAPAFEGHYLLAETYDAAWRERHGFDSGVLYADGAEQIAQGADVRDDLGELSQELQELEGDALRSYLLDHVDVAAVIDYNAAAALANHQDWNFFYNVYEYRDASGRWSYLPGDLSNAMVMPIFAGEDPSDLTPIDPRAMGGEAKQPLRIIEDAMFEFPEFRAQYYERLRTLQEEILGSGQLDRWYDELYAASAATLELDLRRWQQDRQSTYEELFPDGPPFTFADDFPIDDAENRFVAGSLSAAEQDQIYRYGLDKLQRRWAAWLEAPELAGASRVGTAEGTAVDGAEPERPGSGDGEARDRSGVLAVGAIAAVVLAAAVIGRGRLRR